MKPIVDVHFERYFFCAFGLRDRERAPKAARAAFRAAVVRGGATWDFRRGVWTSPPFREPLKKVLAELEEFQVMFTPALAAKLTEGMEPVHATTLGAKRADAGTEELLCAMLGTVGIAASPAPRE